MKRALGVLTSLALAAPLVVLATTAAGRADAGACGAGRFCVGAASVDTTWHVGAGQGQYGTDGNGITHDKFDPFHHQTKQVPTDGIQSRNFAKGIVVQGADGTKVAFVKTDQYLQQDVLTRRVAELVSGADPLVRDFVVDGLDGSRIMIGTTHNHSVPQYMSTAYGVMLFTDTFDFRAFEFTARRVAQAIKEADAALAPAKMGASVSRFDDIQRNIIGPRAADDGTPAGFPHDYFDDELAVIRFDAADGSGPIAAWVNFGMHPESLGTVDLISADFTGMVERMVERGMGRLPGAAEGPVVAWSQGAVGDIEPDRDGRANPPALGREYWHREFAQAERMSRALAGAVLDTWRDVAAGTPKIPEKHVPFTTEVPVAMLDHRFAGPPTHPLPTVSNCRTDHPGVPVVGLPDCERGGLQPPDEYGTTIDLLREHGVPVPSNFGSAPSYEGVQESLRIHLQAIRLGDVLVASCPCEPITDMVRNFKSRADALGGNIHDGFEWPCETQQDGRVLCDFRTASFRDTDLREVDPDAHERMLAQIHNDAAGWEDDVASLQGEAESHDPEDIFGNFTKVELDAGYTLPVLVGQANDYVGYIVTYREYQRGDHYRKALTAFGPHTADYVNTRLVTMAAALKGGPPVEDATLDPVVGPIDELLQTAKVLATGTAGTHGTAAYERALPDDGGTPGPMAEPKPLERFGAATFSWIGGSNWTDNPNVVVQRKEGDEWATVATQEGGEVVVTIDYGSYRSTAPLGWLTGGKTYRWTATFEVFDETAPGEYRFVVDGFHRDERMAKPYHLVSEAFKVRPWSGIVAHDLEVDVAGRSASFLVDGTELSASPDMLETDDDAVLAPDEIHYPDTYASDLAFIRERYERSGPHVFCYRCAFRPWADTGTIATAAVTVRQSDGAVVTYPATFDGARWVAEALDLGDGDVVVVEAGRVVDEFGNVNGAPSNEVLIEGAGERKIATTLAYTGATSGKVGSEAAVSATLTSSGGAPIEAATIMFTRGRQSVTAVTGPDGVASTMLRVEGPPGDDKPVMVSFAGTERFAPASVVVPFTATTGGPQ